MEILFATKNKGKIKEINSILAGCGLEAVSMEEAGIDFDIIEDGVTFEENALKKAVAVMKASGKITLSDDSGLEVDYLMGEPGVMSARFMGEATPYDVKNARILELLNNAKGKERAARFVCVIAAAFPESMGIPPFTVRRTLEGEIAQKPAGSGGFGYDPILFIPERNKTTAELSMEEKNRISHRGQALSAMKDELNKLLG